MESYNVHTPEHLCRLSPTELEHLLQTELEKPTDSIDAVLVKQILKNLEIHGKNPLLTDNAAVQQACTKFRQKTNKGEKPAARWWQHYIIKVASVVLVLGFLFFSLPGIAQADTIQDVLTYWSDGIFQFFFPGKTPNINEHYVFQTSNPDLQRIYDTAIELGITSPLIPMWIPEGFTLSELEVLDFFEDKALYATLENANKNIYLTVLLHKAEVHYQHEKDSQDVKIITFQGVDHYLITNNGEHTVTWWTDGIEYSVVTDCQEAEIHKLLCSIYAPED